LGVPQLRYNLITRQWVIIATERVSRPDQFRRKTSGEQKLPQYVPSCPFCPGNEDQTPPEVLRLPKEGPWQVRVTPNRYAALTREGELVRSGTGIKRTVTGVGIHDVIVETPDHSKTTALLDDQQVEKIVEAYRQRYLNVLCDERVEQVTIFKNHGEAAGTSLQHPHSQLIATPVIPTEMRDRMEMALRYYDETGACIFCHNLSEEMEEGSRVVLETERFVAFIPFAALSPFHIWIFPKRHEASFGAVTDSDLSDLARMLRRVLLKLHRGLNNPDFNYTIRTAPTESGWSRYYHWYLSVVARVTRLAGFEIGSGMFINVAMPEESAKFLRDTVVE
jgi:UDPglucose--hexose-1-phosphate uridylyltransferase